MIFINNIEIKISDILNYSIAPEYRTSLKRRIIYYNLKIQTPNKLYNEKLNTIETEEIKRIHKLIYYYLIKYNSNFEYPSIKISNQLRNNKLTKSDF